MEQRTSVTGTVNYLGPMDTRPRFFSEAYQNNNLNLEPHAVAVEDFRLRRGETALASTGYTLLDHPSSLTGATSLDAVTPAYIEEVRELVAAVTGAPRVAMTRPVFRCSERDPHPDRINSRPGRFVHVDYSRDAFHDFARQHLGDDPEAEQWLSGRYAAFNVWRVMSPPPQDCPLAVLDRSTTAREDVIEGDSVIDSAKNPFSFGSSLYRFSPRHRWGYFSGMTVDEALIFAAYDSVDDGLPGCPHSAFDDPTAPPDAPPRASCEIRAYAYWGPQ